VIDHTPRGDRSERVRVGGAMSNHTSFFLAVSLVSTAALPSMASAQYGPLLEATIGAGIGDRSSTGVGEPLLGLGYDQSTGPLASLDVRLLIERPTHWLAYGVLARAAHHAGPTMELASGAAFRTTVIDLGITGRVEFPCMRSGDLSVHLGGFLAISGLVSDAGRGDVARPSTDNETREAASRLDHGGLGGAFGLSLDLHYGAFVAGLGFDLHQSFGIDSIVARDLLLAGQLRLGAEISL
jgi:hypothetical protein